VCLQTRPLGASHSTHLSHSWPNIACKSEILGVEECLLSSGKLIVVLVADMTASRTDDEHTVNPAWGLTRAGAPRKRLPQACLSVLTTEHKSQLQLML